MNTQISARCDRRERWIQRLIRPTTTEATAPTLPCGIQRDNYEPTNAFVHDHAVKTQERTLLAPPFDHRRPACEPQPPAWPRDRWWATRHSAEPKMGPPNASGLQMDPALRTNLPSAPSLGHRGRPTTATPPFSTRPATTTRHRWPNRLGAWLGLRTIVQTKLPHYAAMGMIEVRYDYRPKPPLKEPTDDDHPNRLRRESHAIEPKIGHRRRRKGGCPGPTTGTATSPPTASEHHRPAAGRSR